MFGLMDFSPLAYPWSLGQRDVGSTSVHSSSSCLWNEMVSFLLFQTSSLPYSLVYIWLHFHGDLLLLVSLSTVLLSLFYTMKSDFSKDMSALTDAVFLPCTHSTPSVSVPVSPFPALKQFTPRSPETSICQIQGPVFHLTVVVSTAERSFLTETLSSLGSPFLSLFWFLLFFKCLSQSALPAHAWPFSVRITISQTRSLVCFYSLLFSWMVKCMPIAYGFRF